MKISAILKPILEIFINRLVEQYRRLVE